MSLRPCASTPGSLLSLPVRTFDARESERIPLFMDEWRCASVGERKIRTDPSVLPGGLSGAAAPGGCGESRPWLRREGVLFIEREGGYVGPRARARPRGPGERLKLLRVGGSAAAAAAATIRGK